MGYNNDLINTTSLLSPPWFHCLCLLSWYWEGFYGKAGNWEWQGNDHSCINDSTPLALVQSEGKQSSSGTFSLFFEECIMSVLCWYSDDMFSLFVSRSDKQIRKEIEKNRKRGSDYVVFFWVFFLFLLNSCLLKEQHTRAHTHVHTHTMDQTKGMAGTTLGCSPFTDCDLLHDPVAPPLYADDRLWGTHHPPRLSRLHFISAPPSTRG